MTSTVHYTKIQPKRIDTRNLPTLLTNIVNSLGYSNELWGDTSNFDTIALLQFYRDRHYKLLLNEVRQSECYDEVISVVTGDLQQLICDFAETSETAPKALVNHPFNQLVRGIYDYYLLYLHLTDMLPITFFDPFNDENVDTSRIYRLSNLPGFEEIETYLDLCDPGF